MIEDIFQNNNESITDFTSLLRRDDDFDFSEHNNCPSIAFLNQQSLEAFPFNFLSTPPKPQDVVTLENEYKSIKPNIIKFSKINEKEKNKSKKFSNNNNNEEKVPLSLQKPQNIKTNKNNENKFMGKKILRSPKTKKVKTKKKNIKKIYFETNKKNTLKAGNNTKKKSKRNWNIYNEIIRNLIQDIYRNWINEGEKNNNKKLKKLSPIIFKSYNFKGSLLNDIYSQEITKKENDTKYNINNINSASGIKKIKLNFSFEDSLKLFYNDNINEEEFYTLFPNLKQEKINMTDFLKGLKTKDIYAEEKGGKGNYKIKLNNNLDKIKHNYLKNE